MTVTINIPKFTPDALSNIFGIIGLLGFTIAIGMLFHSFPAALLVASLIFVGLSYVAATRKRPKAKPVRTTEPTRLSQRVAASGNG